MKAQRASSGIGAPRRQMEVAGRHKAPAASLSISNVRTGDWVVPRGGTDGTKE
jgi:hypothetical protein